MLKNIRNEIEWFNNNKDYAYLDSAATALKPKSVIDYINYYCNFVSTNPHNDDSTFAHQPHLVIKDTKKKLAKFLNTNEDYLVFTPGATYSLNSVAHFLKPFLKNNDQIVISNAEHSSNILPWYDIYQYYLDIKKRIKIQYVDIDIYSDNINNFLSKVNAHTKIVSFANEFNLTSNCIDANKLATLIKQKNRKVFICVDATQYLAHHKLDLKNTNIDFVVGSAHKMLGPSGIGFLYINPNLIEKVKPYVVGGGMNFEIKRNYYSLLSGTSKFEAGTLNIMGIYGFNKALDYYLDDYFLIAKNQIYLLKKYLDYHLSQIKNIKVLNKNIDAFNSIFVYENVFSQDLSHYLGTKKIIVRSGLSCAKLANEILNYNHVIRSSFHFYTNKSDIDKLINALKDFKKEDILHGLL